MMRIRGGSLQIQHSYFQKASRHLEARPRRLFHIQRLPSPSADAIRRSIVRLRLYIKADKEEPDRPYGAPAR